MSRHSARQRRLHDENENELSDEDGDTASTSTVKRQKRMSLSDMPSSSRSSVKRVRLDSGDSEYQGSCPMPDELINEVMEHSQRDARCGRIVRMRLVNFMCHSNLIVEFNERGNYIVGENGSGKSAILIALMVGLGARAKESGRSSNMRELIKRGHTQARIEITITNDGEEAFEPEKYGRTITVVRTIGVSASYVMKGERGTVITRKMDDFNRMIAFHCLQVNNPVFVMNQDNGREFLKQMTPEKNYSLFLKATYIELIFEALHNSQMHHNVIRRKLKFKKTFIDVTQRQMDELNRKLSKFKSMAKMRTDIRQMECELLWLFVGQCEQELTDYGRKYLPLQQRQKELQAMQLNKDTMVEKSEQRKNEHSTIWLSLKKKHGELDTAYTNMRQDQQEKERQFKEVTDKIVKLKQEEQKTQGDIAEVNRLLSRHNNGDKEASRQRDMQTLQDWRVQLENIAAVVQSGMRDYRMFKESRLQMEVEQKDLQQKWRECNNELTSIDRNISSMQTHRKDSLAVYGSDACRLVAEIQKAHSQGRFSEMPLGPLGQYIQVPDVHYRDAVEQLLGRNLHAFVVNSQEDRQVVDNILREKLPNYKVDIITTKFIKKVFNVRKGCVRSPNGTILLMDLIQCSSPVVMNCLIDRCQIETILVTESKEHAEQLTSDSENVPKHLRKIFVQLTSNNMCLEYHPWPKYRTYSRKLQTARYLQIDVQERIKQLLANRKSQQEVKAELAEQLAKCLAYLKENNHMANEKTTLIEQNKYAHTMLKKKIEELQGKDYDTDEMEMLNKEKRVLEAKFEKFEKLIDEEKCKLSELRNAIASISVEIMSKRDAIMECKANMDEQKKLVDDENLKCKQFDRVLERSRVELNDIAGRLQQLDAHKGELQAKLDQAIATATKKGARVASQRTAEYLQETIERQKQSVERSEAQNIDPEVLSRQLEALYEQYTINRKNYDTYNSYLEQLENTIRMRFNFMKKFRRRVALVLGLRFDQYLRERNFHGKLIVDIERGAIDINVRPRQSGDDKNVVDDAKSLSGGERSYTTLAFLLSLWSCVNHPFYFLDEYDVFTDEVNRSIMNSLLMKEIHRRPRRQYCFLTPQSMSLESSDYISIMQLDRPDFSNQQMEIAT